MTDCIDIEKWMKRWDTCDNMYIQSYIPHNIYQLKHQHDNRTLLLKILLYTGNYSLYVQ